MGKARPEIWPGLGRGNPQGIECSLRFHCSLEFMPLSGDVELPLSLKPLGQTGLVLHCADEGPPLHGSEHENAPLRILGVAHGDFAIRKLGELDTVATAHAVGGLRPAQTDEIQQHNILPEYGTGPAPRRVSSNLLR